MDLFNGLLDSIILFQLSIHNFLFVAVPVNYGYIQIAQNVVHQTILSTINHLGRYSSMSEQKRGSKEKDFLIPFVLNL